MFQIQIHSVLRNPTLQTVVFKAKLQKVPTMKPENLNCLINANSAFINNNHYLKHYTLIEDTQTLHTKTS